jgi:hypothetical protein
VARLVFALVAVFALAVLTGLAISWVDAQRAPQAAPVAPILVAIPPQVGSTPADAATTEATLDPSVPEAAVAVAEVTPEPSVEPAVPMVARASQPIDVTTAPSAPTATRATVAATATPAVLLAAAPVAPAPAGLTGGVATALFQQADDLEMAFSVAPGLAGPNDLNFYLRDVNGDDRPYQRLIARITYLDSARGTQVVEPVQLHEGHWPIDRYELGLAGRWRIEASVSREGLRDTNFSFELQLAHR